MKVKVSDYIFDFLTLKGVDTVFSVSGGAAAHLLNSVKEKNLKYICNYHEQACAMAAEGYARIAKKPACVLVTNGPGSSNTITGVLGAHQDSIPMIVISGQVPTNQSLNSLKNVNLRQLGVQECDIISMVKPITKYAIQITNPNDVINILEEAYTQATTGRMGPVWIDIPLDIQSSQIEPPEPFNWENIINLILQSKKPVIITGNGIHLSNSEDLFYELKEKLQIPVVSTWTSKDLMNQNDPLFVGNFGLLGERAGNFAIQNADLLLVLGSRLSIPNVGYQSHLFSPKSIKIVIDIDKNELNKPTIKIDYPVNKDLNSFLVELNSRLTTKTIPNWGSWIEKTQTWKDKYPVFQPEYKNNTHKINSFYFMEVLSTKLKDNHIVVTDMGTSYTCTMQSLQLNGKTRLFTSSACCSMGFGLPGAIGAYYADPSKDIILIAGDGGFQMTIQELGTIFQTQVPVKIVVLNNEFLGMVRQWQQLFFDKRYASTEMINPNFIAIAEGYYIKAKKVTKREDLDAAVAEMMASKESYFLEVLVEKENNVFPMIPTGASVSDIRLS
jgi:acetolactate synthase-1/2/3 large subunit